MASNRHYCRCRTEHVLLALYCRMNPCRSQRIECTEVSSDAMNWLKDKVTQVAKAAKDLVWVRLDVDFCWGWSIA